MVAPVPPSPVARVHPCIPVCLGLTLSSCPLQNSRYLALERIFKKYCAGFFFDKGVQGETPAVQWQHTSVPSCFKNILKGINTSQSWGRDGLLGHFRSRQRLGTGFRAWLRTRASLPCPGIPFTPCVPRVWYRELSMVLRGQLRREAVLLGVLSRLPPGYGQWGSCMVQRAALGFWGVLA